MCPQVGGPWSQGKRGFAIAKGARAAAHRLMVAAHVAGLCRARRDPGDVDEEPAPVYPAPRARRPRALNRATAGPAHSESHDPLRARPMSRRWRQGGRGRPPRWTSNPRTTSRDANPARRQEGRPAPGFTRFHGARTKSDFRDHQGSWTRVNALKSPWPARHPRPSIGSGRGNEARRESMEPKRGAGGTFHYVSTSLLGCAARGEATAWRSRSVVHAILENRRRGGVKNVADIAAASPRDARHEPRPRRISAASREIKTTRVGGGHPDYRVLSIPTATRRAPARSRTCGTTRSRAWWTPACRTGSRPSTAPSADFSDAAACEAQFRNAFLLGCAGAWTLPPEPDRQSPSASSRRRSRRCCSPARILDANAGWNRRGDDRRQDAGRRHLESRPRSSSISRGSWRRRTPGSGAAYGL